MQSLATQQKTIMQTTELTILKTWTLPTTKIPRGLVTGLPSHPISQALQPTLHILSGILCIFWTDYSRDPLTFSPQQVLSDNAKAISLMFIITMTSWLRTLITLGQTSQTIVASSEWLTLKRTWLKPWQDCKDYWRILTVFASTATFPTLLGHLQQPMMGSSLL